MDKTNKKGSRGAMQFKKEKKFKKGVNSVMLLTEE